MGLTGWDYLKGIKAVGLESEPDGMVHPEIEITVYVKVKNLDFLKAAYSHEVHEQWKLPFKEDGNVRARLRVTNGVVHTLTTKKKRANSYGDDEVEHVITSDLYAHLKLAAVDGYKKTRYNFPIPDTVNTSGDEPLKWEVDVFPTNGGASSLWLKVDLEIVDLNMTIPQLPFQAYVERLIIPSDPNATEEDDAEVDRLWAEEWQRLDVK